MKSHALVTGAWTLAALACGGGSSGPDSGGDPAGSDAAGGGDARPRPDGGDPASHRVIFATSSKQNGDLGGLDGADDICGQRAGDAGLQGTFKAWLSASGEAAQARLAHAEVPYVRTDGERIADDWDDLVDGDLAAPIDRDEEGAAISGDVWTGTRPNGGVGDATCGGFGDAGDVGVCGSSGSTNGDWSDFIQPFCTSALRLYCVQQ